ncbi:MAG: hypothetical protein KDM81_20960, partial [Verrucomicrobiae bacterium]|nr:hypothetical protein [Verrucomicrobiae bacterium]
TQPADYANFLPASSSVSFKVTDDKALPKDKITLLLNGQAPDAGTETRVDVDAEGKVVRYTLTGGLAADANYVATLSAEDSDGEVTTRTVYFDTFSTSRLVIEVEDYNYYAGEFIDNPVVTAEGWWNPASYNDQQGIVDIDFSDTRTTPNGTDTPYRLGDPVRMQHSLDIVRKKYADAGGSAAGVWEYDVVDIAADEWLQYTRTFPAGFYEVYLRQSMANMPAAESMLERVTGNRGQENPAREPVGSFLGTKSGFQYRNTPLTDGTGQQKTVLQLSGVTTFRLRQVTGDAEDGARAQNYMVFIPVPDPGTQRASILSLSPVPDSTVKSVTPAIAVEIRNRQTSVKTDTI